MRAFPRLQGVNRTAAKLAGVALVMVSLSFAAVPFYDWFCRTTGFGGTTGVAETGSASYNVTPDAAGAYFEKIACFCFELQVLQPGERVQMPVTFFVDPAIVTGRDGQYVKEITLSYTFHETELPDEQAALAPTALAPVN